MPAPLVWLVIFAILMVVTPNASRAQDLRVTFRTTQQMDAAGAALRRAATAWQDASRDYWLFDWQAFTATPGEGIVLGRYLLVASLDREGGVALRLLDSSPQGVDATGRVRPGETAQIGTLQVQLERSSPELALRIRRSQPRLMAAANDPMGSSPRILGSEVTRDLTISSRDPRELQFARVFLESMASGDRPEAAAHLAFRAVPPAIPQSASSLPRRRPGERDEVAELLGEEDIGAATSALVTLRLVSGEVSAMQRLNSGGAFDSQGRTGTPRVRGSVGGDGGRIAVGGPGDRFQASLEALEAEGRVDVEQQTMLRVPLGGSARTALSGPGGSQMLEVFAELEGRRVRLRLATSGSVAQGAGALNTVVVLPPGATRMVGGATRTETRSGRSAPPILGDIPIVGGAIGSRESSSVQGSSTWFATVDLD